METKKQKIIEYIYPSHTKSNVRLSSLKKTKQKRCSNSHFDDFTFFLLKTLFSFCHDIFAIYKPQSLTYFKFVEFDWSKIDLPANVTMQFP